MNMPEEWLHLMSCFTRFFCGKNLDTCKGPAGFKDVLPNPPKKGRNRISTQKTWTKTIWLKQRLFCNWFLNQKNDIFRTWKKSTQHKKHHQFNQSAKCADVEEVIRPPPRCSVAPGNRIRGRFPLQVYTVNKYLCVHTKYIRYLFPISVEDFVVKVENLASLSC